MRLIGNNPADKPLKFCHVYFGTYLDQKERHIAKVKLPELHWVPVLIPLICARLILYSILIRSTAVYQRQVPDTIDHLRGILHIHVY